MEPKERIANLSLDRGARAELKAQVDWFTDALTTQAKLVAGAGRRSPVVGQDVVEAADRMFHGARTPTPFLVRLGKAASGIILGVCVPNVLQEFRANDPNFWWGLGNLALAAVGLIFLVWSVADES
ncbi:hypothetical protein [Iamia sp.]|uniref:hypothetical protein n=1 Tax=Iamia sp. TaxID=2722710 RepID=UPI002B8061C1|nr:hypothetical protein [Iamia sp.]HXH58920.1 hypothetical protein [Iamia sp.]